MSNTKGRASFEFTRPPSIKAFASIASKKESEGPMGNFFDDIIDDSHIGQDSWEKAESELQKQTVQMVLRNAGLAARDINFMLGGDLINQCTSTTYSIRDLDIPFLGIYGACSTMSEGLLIAALLSDNGLGKYIMNTTSSHFATAERQFRFPLSYGGQRTPSSQWTCTAAGATILSDEGTAPYIRGGTIGQIVDMGITDANNMGAAMAPSALDTIKRFLDDTGKKPEDFDCIITGDLGVVGSSLLMELFEKEGMQVPNHKDCGVMMFDDATQDTHAGGSGCGCSASILCGYFLPKLRTGEMKNILFAATGALMSPTICQQGESIPGICHLVHISHTNS